MTEATLPVLLPLYPLSKAVNATPGTSMYEYYNDKRNNNEDVIVRPRATQWCVVRALWRWFQKSSGSIGFYVPWKY
jgi:hypothetical protein